MVIDAQSTRLVYLNLTNVWIKSDMIVLRNVKDNEWPRDVKNLLNLDAKKRRKKEKNNCGERKNLKKYENRKKLRRNVKKKKGDVNNWMKSLVNNEKKKLKLKKSYGDHVNLRLGKNVQNRREMKEVGVVLVKAHHLPLHPVVVVVVVEASMYHQV